MKSWAWAAICISVASLGAMSGAAGCSSDDPAGDGDEDGEGGSGSGGTGSGATTGSGPTTGSATGTTTGSGTPSSSTGMPMEGCEDEATYADCFDCFAEEFPAGFDSLNGIYLEDCICGVGADCAADCNPMMLPTAECSMQMPTPECDACNMAIDANSPCLQSTIMACQADADCNELLSAVQGCPST
jgi:hypothetical protein